jgi:pimeloyl-ACP methyl ester carboxylesterase
MLNVIYIALGILLFYLLLTLGLTYLVQQIPRNPVDDKPDWGKIMDTRIPAKDGGLLEVWHIEPRDDSKGVVVFAHGWGRNRDRMVPRARIFGQWGYTTIIHSARDHGDSSPHKFMNPLRFAEDIEAVLSWIPEPAILYGHSIGAAAATIAATRNPEKIKLLFLEGCYANTKEALLSLYRWVNPVFGIVFGPMIVFWMNLFYKNALDKVSPARLAPQIKMPVMLIHGETDRRFPLSFAKRLRDSFSSGCPDMFVEPGAGHSGSSQSADYKLAVKAFLDRNLSRSGFTTSSPRY